MGVVIDAQLRPMCCPGCRAVAELINASGLANFYQQRTAYNQRPPEQEFAPREQYRVYDDPVLAAGFTTEEANGEITAQLLLGGISCAACTWLIEQTMVRVPGVSKALVNLQQGRLDIRFDPARVPLILITRHTASTGPEAGSLAALGAPPYFSGFFARA